VLRAGKVSRGWDHKRRDIKTKLGIKATNATGSECIQDSNAEESKQGILTSRSRSCQSKTDSGQAPPGRAEAGKATRPGGRRQIPLHRL
jgi:hypothetical protein